jgi:hypothetical protein
MCWPMGMLCVVSMIFPSCGLPWNNNFVSIEVCSRLCIEIFVCLLSAFLASCGECDVCTNAYVGLVLLVLCLRVFYVPVFMSLHVLN